ncbi:MAG: sigma-70 family RNA polymerase sigma factor [Prevotellaceae bacterium]|nr:sigma-70 family RNA polymerase sigma factor [Prevotellaceae bacterium]
MTANKQSIDRQIAEYRPKLKSFIRGKVTNREDAEDILQDVFYQFVKTVNTAINPIENLSAWLYRVARNMIINFGAKKREAKMPVARNAGNDSELMMEISELFFDVDDSTPETEYLRSLVWEELENALAELPPEQRTVFELTEFENIPVKEISETTGVSVATLLSRKHYAILHLRKRLKELYNEFIYS